MISTLHLIPVGISDSNLKFWMPLEALKQARSLNVYIAENAKTARSFLKDIGSSHQLNDITIHQLSKNITKEQIIRWLSCVKQGKEIGLISEAGCPAIADPGSDVVSLAQSMGIRIKPWTGPSSIFLSLMASGLNGQSFAFRGYPPIKPDELKRKIISWENESKNINQTQIMIETPYRNMRLLQSAMDNLKQDTMLCIASSITSESEYIRTLSILEWKKTPLDSIQKKPTIFLFLAKGIK
ncbi:methyltransferase [Candidatus Kinetoplastibacterium blastocrithidii TCC012E]|uniref:Methyltransferase n=1 Tax=Candidatus Kinetoplastidibacterium blastocrithidiae TCC012E TaxID=1208922 RepID=M1M0U1_9PROT|nr:SAM-dependent methyltransferase [Candidatus Kinetoplastibacterium blastocrithidii]AFZ83771.1 16S rRNA (cytidine1402-2'-O)-methyltransferase [Candidatus Kinetoplastibacterium blastocrithidii (ex Strigomonas culicis)]AGF49896.1 methyltransferase [Candidatus Kinetoplastibacterium blastocrithidii TCC012E]